MINKKDEQRGMTYGSRIALDINIFDIIAEYIWKAETDKKELLRIKWLLFGYFGKGNHKMIGSKFCAYKGIKVERNSTSVSPNTSPKYIQHIAVSVINNHLVPMLPTTLLQNYVKLYR